MQETPIFEKAASNKERKIVPILGIFVDSTSKSGALNRACPPSLGELRQGEGKLIVTPNPEIIIAAQKDKSLARVLNSADLALPDGIGVVMAMRYLALAAPKNPFLRPIVLVFQGIQVGLGLFLDRKWLFEISEVVQGRRLFEALVGLAAKHGKKVFLLGGKPGVAEKAANALSIKYEVLSIKYNAGPWLDEEGKPRNKIEMEAEKEAIKQINAFKPHFLFVGFGHPKQEKWLARFVEPASPRGESRRARNLPGLKVGLAAMTVGGAFDYLAGQVPKPPSFLAEFGLEWFWRLLTQGWRLGRILNAVVVFPLLLYLYRLKNAES